jgi:hypothetical protein
MNKRFITNYLVILFVRDETIIIEFNFWASLNEH